MKKMKLTLASVLFFVSIGNLFAQDGVMINYGAGTRDNSAILDLRSTNQGFLAPKVNIADLSTAAPVTTPAEGLIVYNENNGTGEGYYYWTGTEWTRLLNGNSAPPTGSGTLNYVTKWTPDGTQLGNSQLFDNGTNMGIGTAAPKGKLEVIGDIWATEASTNDNALRIRPGLASGNQYGFADQHNNMMAFVNEQGTTNQAFVLGDVNINDGATLFGVSVATGGTNPTTGAEAGWSKRFEVAGNGTIKLNTYTTNGIVRTTSGDGTLSSSGGAIDLTSEVTGVLPVANGGSGTGTAFTPGSVIFAGTGGVYSEDNPNLFWDDATDGLGIGTASPDQLLELSGGGMQLNGSYGIGFTGEIPADGNVVTDGAKMYYESDFFGTNLDGLVIEKTDGNGTTPDGGIAFTTKGSDNVRETAMVIRGNNNVGINTIDPSEELDIDGQIRMRTGASNGFVPIGDANGVMTWTDPALIGSDDDDWAKVGGGLPTLTDEVYHTGNVGIGTTDPDVKLDIQTAGYGLPATTGSAQTYAGLRISPPSSSGNVVLDMGTGGGTNGAWLQTTLRTTLGNTYPLLLNPNGGNVGVGTTTPDANLDVEGSVSFPLLVQRTGDVDEVGIEFHDDASSGQHGYISFNHRDGSSMGNLASFHLRSTETTLGVILEGEGGYYAGSDVALRSNGISYLNGGNVGIGTAGPAQRLDVEGNIMHTGSMMSRGPNYSSTWMQFDEHQHGNSLVLGSGGLAILGAGESANTTNTALANPSLETLHLTADGGIEFKTSVNSGWATRVDAMSILSDGKIGMGTTAPTRNLVIEHDGDAAIWIDGDRNNSGESDNAYLKISQDGHLVEGILGFVGADDVDPEANTYTGMINNSLLLGTTSAHDLQFGTNGNVRMTVESGGDIGIGTTNPNARLDVQGGLAQFEGGMETDKRYYYFQRYGHTTSSSGWDDSETHNLGAWDFCAVGQVGFKNDESATDEDDDVQCAVYPNGQGGAGEQTDYTANFTQNHDQRPTWIMYFEAFADTNGITCAANCINFKH